MSYELNAHHYSLPGCYFPPMDSTAFGYPFFAGSRIWSRAMTRLDWGTMSSENPTPHEGPQSVRLDAWLWAVRLYKTRSAATTACRAGHVRLNDQPVKASQALRVGDVVKVRTPGWERVFEVTALLTKRVGAPVARKCYNDHSPPRPTALSAPVPRREPGAGRPTKKERRELEKLRGRL